MAEVYKILVVEDDDAVRLTLVEFMKMYGYVCISAENGTEGFDKALEYKPDIILSDVNMPVMDGNELTKKLRSTPGLAHIPLIMLTASSAEEDRIKGLTSGAVDFIPKPFNTQELQLKIKNLLATRKELENSSWRAVLANSYSDIPNLDEQFIADLYAKVEENIALSNYPARDLAEDMKLSERNLYRKVKENMGMTVSDFIREVKLQHAHELLEQGKVKTITDAALRVGFKSAGHFSKMYNEKFG